MDKHEDIKKELVIIGQKLGFLAFDEIGAGQEKSSWPDVVWFDNRIRGEWFDGIAPISQKDRKRKGGKPSLDTDFVLPLVGFEIDELSSSPKTVKGSVSNLESLGVQVGVLVVYTRIVKPARQKLVNRKKHVLCYLTDMKPRIRIVVLTELDIERIGANIDKVIPV